MGDTAVTFDIGGAVNAGQSAVQFVVNLLTGARSVIIQVENWSSLTLHYKGSSHSSGGFVVWPADKIESGKANVFGSQNTGGSIMTGTEGYVQYSGDWGLAFEGDPNYQSVILYSVIWANPYFGDNWADSMLVGSQNTTFRIRYGPGKGNTGAQFIYRIYDKTQISGPPKATL